MLCQCGLLIVVIAWGVLQVGVESLWLMQADGHQSWGGCASQSTDAAWCALALPVRASCSLSDETHPQLTCT